MEKSVMDGEEIQDIVKRLACKEDLSKRDRALEVSPFL